MRMILLRVKNAGVQMSIILQRVVEISEIKNQILRDILTRVWINIWNRQCAFACMYVVCMSI